jgi:catechol 2,3-dioxygenase-like lactoylglutathione lyase family enzyme
MSMILYVTLGSQDVEIASRFYDAALAPLGYSRSADPDAGWAGWGPDYDDGVSIWICPPFNGQSPTPGNGAMVAFRANSAAQVRAFHAAAIAHGGMDEGAPGVRPDYEPGFYAAYVRDPDGNKLACVFHRYDPALDHLAP